MAHRTLMMPLTLLLLAGCSDEAAPAMAAVPSAELERPQTPKKASIGLAIAGSQNVVTFTMEAPFERQEGRVPSSAVTGELELDLRELGRSRGLVNVDIAELEIFQERAKEAGAYEMREKSELQNEHMRDWLEIGEDAPAEVREKNRLVQFSIEEVRGLSQTDVLAIPGAERRVNFTAVGDFRLHQRVARKELKLAATFHMQGDALRYVEVETLEPFTVSLPEHDVRPRTGFGALASKTLEAMAPKVAKEAAVSLSVRLESRESSES